MRLVRREFPVYAAGMKKKIAANMRRIRERVFAMTMTEFAKAGGVSASTVSRWEAGMVVPSLADVWALRIYAGRHDLEWDDARLFARR